MTHPFMTVDASTKRNPAPVAGRITAPVTYLASLLVTPLWPVNPETAQTLELSSPRESKQCFHVPVGDTLPDVIEGDVLVVGGVEYIVQYVAEWPDLAGGVPSLQIVCEKVKGT